MTIVVGYRPNEFGEAALDHAIARAKGSESRLVVVNVSTDQQMEDPDFVRGYEFGELRMKLGNSRLAGYDIVQPMGVDTAGLILKVVQDESASLLVIGLRQRSAVGKFLMGSVAQQILLDSPVPVLSVKPGQNPVDIM
ncbi:MAG: universal stress protein [Aeromicrobium sp.]